MRLTSLRMDGAEPAALVRPSGAVLLTAVNEALGTDWPTTRYSAARFIATLASTFSASGFSATSVP